MIKGNVRVRKLGDAAVVRAEAGQEKAVASGRKQRR
jgi:hypothetical protein